MLGVYYENTTGASKSYSMVLEHMKRRGIPKHDPEVQLLFFREMQYYQTLDPDRRNEIRQMAIKEAQKLLKRFEAKEDTITAEIRNYMTEYYRRQQNQRAFDYHQTKEK
jgi:TRAP-type C4-dicarboxylate transport system substrate-binding protein